MESVAELIHLILGLYWWCLVAFVIMSWLIAFNVVNTYNRFVFSVNDFLFKITEPALRPIRRIVPNLGGIDISPIILIIIIWFLQRLIERNFY